IHVIQYVNAFLIVFICQGILCTNLSLKITLKKLSITFSNIKTAKTIPTPWRKAPFTLKVNIQIATVNNIITIILISCTMYFFHIFLMIMSGLWYGKGNLAFSE